METRINCKPSLVDNVLSQIAKLSKRAEQTGFGGLTAEHVATVVNDTIDGRTFSAVIEIRGEVPKVNGWTFAARVEHGLNGNLVTKAPWTGEIAEAWRTVDARCEHCNLTRKRSVTYVITGETGETGEQRIVGSTCLEDFTRSTEVAKLLKFWAELDKLNCGDGEGSPGRVRVATVSEWLQATITVVRLDGFRSAKLERATKDVVANVLWPDRRAMAQDPEYAKRIRERRTPTEKDRADLAACLEWATTKAEIDTSDFWWNIRVLLKDGLVVPRFYGWVSGIVAAWHKELGVVRARAARVPSAHWGTVGKREVFEGELVHQVRLEGEYGVSTLCKFVTDAGQVIVWIASRCPDLNTGSRYAGKATVKSHSERNGEAQTKVTRAALSRA